MYAIKRQIAAVAASLALVATLTACGGGNSGSSSSSGGNSGSSSSGGDIPVGVMQDLSGPLGAFGKLELQGIQIATDQINADGGVLGKKIKLVEQDLASNQANVSSGLSKLRSEKVVGVLGPTSSTALQIASPLAQSYGIPMIAPTSNEGFASGVLNKWVHRIAPVGTKIFSPSMEGMLKSAGNPKRLAVFSDPAQNVNQQQLSLVKDGAKDLGYDVVATVSSPAGQTDVSSAVSKVLASNPDVIYMNHGVAESAAFMKVVRERGSKVPFIGGVTFSSLKTFALAGSAGDGALTWVPFLPSSGDPVSKKFIDAYSKKFGDAPDAIAAEAHDSMLVLAAALKKAGSTDAAKIVSAFDGLKVVGVLGPISYKAGESDNSTATVQVVRIKDGAYVKVE